MNIFNEKLDNDKIKYLIRLLERKYSNFLESNDMDSIFYHLDYDDRPDVFKFFYSYLDIDVLKYSTRIFAYEITDVQTDIPDLIIPKNIDTIEYHGVTHCNIGKLIIKNLHIDFFKESFISNRILEFYMKPYTQFRPNIFTNNTFSKVVFPCSYTDEQIYDSAYTLRRLNTIFRVEKGEEI